jgi:mannose-6-phosphate isomerase-like protein (cupin superfamily)
MKPCQSRREALNLHGILAAANCWRVQRARPHGRKGQGSIRWHKHDSTDDFFVVLKGRVTIQMRDGNVSLGPGEMFVVPKGAEHCPVAEEESHILLIEPSGTPNTGNAETAAPRRVV